MKRIRFIEMIMMLCMATMAVNAQVSGTIKGQVKNGVSGEPSPFATVRLLETEPSIGTVTDFNGYFRIENIPMGRYSVEISSLGYDPNLVKELLVTSGKEVVLNVTLQESFVELEEVIVRPHVNKQEPVNDLAGISARMLSVEEANRYAGGFDDPARLASSFAGVSSGLQNNGIVVRGNNPGALLWLMEGVEISNPNHFADLSSFGGGGLTALSSQMLANSDFLTGAFPSAYTNAISGVFDLSMKNGNNDRQEHTFQAGILGIDASSEGPLAKGSNATYLFNYRYSTLGLLEPLLPENAGGTNYQDFAFKFKIPTKSAGIFSWWGLGLLDKSGKQAVKDMGNWKYESDQLRGDISQYMGSSGLKHVFYAGKKSFFETDLAVTSNGLNVTSDKIMEGGQFTRDERIRNGNLNVVIQSKFKKRVGRGSVYEVGARSYFQNYDLLLQHRDDDQLATVVNDQGASLLFSAFAQSVVRITDHWKFQGGVNFQHFSLNGQSTLEPRASLEWSAGPNSLGMAYGLHSRVEKLNYYLNSDVNGLQQNKNSKLTRSHHLVGTYGRQINQNLWLKVEPYFQYLFDVPVHPGSSFSFLNLKNDWFINDKLANDGLGMNYGFDVTLERSLNKGYYYLLTGSIFKSKYKGGDGAWRSTAFDRGFVSNILIGKEWFLGPSSKNIFGLNARITYQGGQRYVPVDEAASLLAMDIVEDEFNAYSGQLNADVIFHFSASYRINKPKLSSVGTLGILNATMVQEFEGFDYNRQTNQIDQLGEPLFIPNISYKIEF